MIDWHSHILPDVDDGSRNLDESIQMLDALISQGVDTVAATPHFYANAESVDEFLSRRDEACEALCKKAEDRNIRIVCGAEVRYYPGISRMEDLGKLKIGGTNLLLLEMPMTKWTDYTVNELIELANTRSLKLVMAHIERYIRMQDNRVLGKLLENSILIQANASFFDRFATRKKAVRMLESGCIHFIGSDCHNLTSRPPKLEFAYDLIRRKLGEDFVSQMNEYGYQVVGQQVQI